MLAEVFLQKYKVQIEDPYRTECKRDDTLQALEHLWDESSPATERYRIAI